MGYSQDSSPQWGVLQYLLTCTCCVIHSGRVEPTSSMEKYGDDSWVVGTLRSPVPASLHLLALQLKPSLSGLGASGHPLVTHPLC